MMKARRSCARNTTWPLRSIMSAGETVGETVCHWAQEAPRRHQERDVRADRDQLHRRQLRGSDGARRGHGRGYPGHDLAVLDDEASRAPARWARSGKGAAATARWTPVFMLGYWNNPQATAEKFFGGGIDDAQAWGRTGDPRGRWTGWAALVPGAQR